LSGRFIPLHIKKARRLGPIAQTVEDQVRILGEAMRTR
jgi:hypothetical protein